MPDFLTAVPIVPVRDVQATTSWYRDTFGFDVFLAEHDYGIVGRGEAWIHFCCPTELPGESTTSLRVGVRGIDELYARLETLPSVQPSEPPQEQPWGFREFSVADPNGNLVTFFEPPAGYEPRSD